MSEVNKVTIAGKQYEITELKLKHLKQITKLIAEPAPTAVYESLSRFFPFIAAAIKEKNPEFTEEMLDDGTLTEVSTAWSTVIDYSGIKIVSKLTGETKPTVDPALTGVTSSVV